MPTHAVIAHLSDLHYGNHDRRVEGHLQEDLLKDPPDFIVVTGDVSQLQWESQFNEAKDFLKGIVSAFWEKGHSARVIVIPGNHDVSTDKGRTAWDKAFPDWKVGGIEGVCRPGNLVDYHAKSSQGDHSRAEDRANEDWRYCEYYPQCQLAFLKFDSNQIFPAFWQRWSPGWIIRNYARGQVGDVQINTMKSVLDRYSQAYPAGTDAPAFEDARKIALVHHHVHYLPNVGSDSIFLMLDAGLFWRTMIELGVELILHGHKHFATHAVIRYMAQRGGGRVERELMVLSAGTATSEDRPEGSNSYYRLEADLMSCRVQQRRHKEVCFEDDGPAIVFRRDVEVAVPGAPYPIDGAALDAILTPDEIDYVHNLDIEEILYVGTIDKDLGYGMEITYAGTRLRGELFLTVPVVVVNAPARERTFKPVVTDLLAEPNKTIQGVKVEKHVKNVRKLVIKIPLPQTNQGDRFRIRLNVFTPAMMYDVNDFDAVGLLRYHHGPTAFRYALRSEREFLGVRCFAIYRSGLRPLDVPKIARDADGLYVVRPTIGSVAALGSGVLCHYHELLPMPTAPAAAGSAS